MKLIHRLSHATDIDLLSIGKRAFEGILLPGESELTEPVSLASSEARYTLSESGNGRSGYEVHFCARERKQYGIDENHLVTVSCSDELLSGARSRGKLWELCLHAKEYPGRADPSKSGHVRVLKCEYIFDARMGLYRTIWTGGQRASCYHRVGSSLETLNLQRRFIVSVDESFLRALRQAGIQVIE